MMTMSQILLSQVDRNGELHLNAKMVEIIIRWTTHMEGSLDEQKILVEELKKFFPEFKK